MIQDSHLLIIASQLNDQLSMRETQERAEKQYCLHYNSTIELRKQTKTWKLFTLSLTTFLPIHETAVRMKLATQVPQYSFNEWKAFIHYSIQIQAWTPHTHGHNTIE